MTVIHHVYEGTNLCAALTNKEKCFRVNVYKEGKIDEPFHEHIPARRISQSNAVETLRSLVAQYSNWPDEALLHSRLNRLPGPPYRSPGFLEHTTYPQPGVVRHYVSGGGTVAWFDKIASEKLFINSKPGEGPL